MNTWSYSLSNLYRTESFASSKAYILELPFYVLNNIRNNKKIGTNNKCFVHFT